MSRLSLLFASRYLRSRKSLSVINIISRVSIFAVGVPVAAMVILLSVFNGFNGLVHSMYSTFDPDIMITPAQGKVFAAGELDATGFAALPEVAAHSHVLEESVMFEYRGRQTLGTLRGVDDRYEQVVPIRDLIVAGEYELVHGEMQQAIVGQGLAVELQVRTAFYNTLDVYAPRRGQFSSLLPMEAVTIGHLYPDGIFALDMDTDGTYTICPLEFTRELLDYEGRSSSVSVRLAPGVNPKTAKTTIERTVGDDYLVKTRYEQKASMYRMLQYEKWGIFFIVLLVLVIASFSIVGSLVMLIIDKRPDIRILFTMGGDARFIRRIFTDEGVLIGVIGTAGGVLLGILVCWLQQTFGFVRLAGQTFLVDYYPVVMRWEDILLIIAATLCVNWIITKFTVAKMIPRSSAKL